MRVLVCDDHPIVRRGLREILEQAGAPVTVGEAASVAEGLALARKQPWDTVVLDITMPGRSGLELLKELKSERPNVPVLVLSVHPAEQYAVRVLRAGASGYLTKESAPEELLTAIRRILRGGSCGGNFENYFRCSGRNWNTAGDSDGFTGFRCVL